MSADPQQSGAILPQRGGVIGHLSDFFWRRPGMLIAVMLAPPLIWLGVVYI